MNNLSLYIDISVTFRLQVCTCFLHLEIFWAYNYPIIKNNPFYLLYSDFWRSLNEIPKAFSNTVPGYFCHII